MITLKFWGGAADDRTVIEPIHYPDYLQIPQKGVSGDRQPPPRRQPQRQRDHTPASKLYRPDGAIEGAESALDESAIIHIDLVG